MGEELAAASVAALDFIENQDRVVFRTSLAESLHEFVCRQLDAAYALYAFDNHCADISFGQFGLHGFDVVQREVGDVPQLLMGAMILGLFVTSTASEVRPWNAFEKDITRVRPL